MSAFKDLAKGGWHPGGEKKPSYATSSSSGGRFSNIKGADKVAGLLGKGGPKPSSREAYADHRSTPLSALQDPDSFGPPPKNYGSGGSASAGQSQNSSNYGSSSATQGGLGSSSVRAKPVPPARPKPAEEEERPRPTGPFRPDTTGLSTANLPAPPVRRAGGFTSEPPAVSSPSSNAPRAPPKLPPRLPPRQAAVPADPPPAYSSPPPQSNTGTLNTAATDRLAKAGISVPGFNIGGTYKPPVPAAPSTPYGPSQSTKTPTPGGTGTTWAEKRATLETAQKFKTDPSSVSLNDMKTSADTAKNFHDRHGEQVATGMRFANKLNSQVGGGQSAAGSTSTGLSSGFGGLKKAAPPPPVKPSDLSGGQPPPVPFGSKPSFF